MSNTDSKRFNLAALSALSPATGAVEQWVASIPATFPDEWDNRPANHNALIGFTQHDTMEAIRDVTRLLEGMAINAEQGKLQLDRQQTNGLRCLLANLAGALDFETSHRPDQRRAGHE